MADLRNLRKKAGYILFLEKQTRYPRILFLNSGERGNKKIGQGRSLDNWRKNLLVLLNFIPSHGCVPLEFVFHRDYRVPYRRGMEIRGRSHPSSRYGWTNFHRTTNSRNNKELYTSNEEKNTFFVRVWIVGEMRKD